MIEITIYGRSAVDAEEAPSSTLGTSASALSSDALNLQESSLAGSSASPRLCAATWHERSCGHRGSRDNPFCLPSAGASTSAHGKSSRSAPSEARGTSRPFPRRVVMNGTDCMPVPRGNAPTAPESCRCDTARNLHFGQRRWGDWLRIGCPQAKVNKIDVALIATTTPRLHSSNSARRSVAQLDAKGSGNGVLPWNPRIVQKSLGAR